MLHVAEPLALIVGPVELDALTLTAQLIVNPVALIDRAILLAVYAVPVALTILPVAEIVGQIRRLTEAEAVLFALVQLANVDGSILGGYGPVLILGCFDELFYLLWQVLHLNHLMQLMLGSHGKILTAIWHRLFSTQLLSEVVHLPRLLFLQRLDHLSQLGVELTARWPRLMQPLLSVDRSGSLLITSCQPIAHCFLPTRLVSIVESHRTNRLYLKIFRFIEET